MSASKNPRSPTLRIDTRNQSENDEQSAENTSGQMRDLSPLKQANMGDVQNDLAMFKVVFELFDKEKTGYVSEQDVIAITVSMKKDVELVKQVYSRIASLRDQESVGYNYGLVSFGEFATLMWEVQQIQQDKATDFQAQNE